jgi:hypothetical protein
MNDRSLMCIVEFAELDIDLARAYYAWTRNERTL